MKIKIPASFDIDYVHIIKSIPCSVQLTTVSDNKKKGKLSVPNTCKGIIKLEEQPLKNAVITFYKPNIKQPNTVDYDTNHYTDGINGVKNWHWNNTFDIHSENYIVDKVMSDDNGYYVSFVTNGIYDILVQYNGQSELLKNQEITDGIEDEFYYYIDGLISQKLHSTYIMVNELARNIKISLLNQYLHLTDGELIITQNNELIVYKKFNNFNKFIDIKDFENYDMFALLPGTYDIRIRNNNTQLLYLKDFEFNIEDDFVDKLYKIINENNPIFVVNKQETIPEVNELVNDETIQP